LKYIKTKASLSNPKKNNTLPNILTTEEINGNYLFESNRGGKLTKKTIGKIVQNSAKKASIN